MFGIPLPFIGFACFLLSALFWFVWPRGKAAPYKRISWPGYILHFFHPLAWVLFGMAVFIAERSPAGALLLGVLGVAVYAVFVVLLIKA